MLALRGAVYSATSGAFQAHDHCACSLEPVYRRDQEWPAGSREYQRIWRETTGRMGGAEARNAFRAALADH